MYTKERIIHVEHPDGNFAGKAETLTDSFLFGQETFGEQVQLFIDDVRHFISHWKERHPDQEPHFVLDVLRDTILDDLTVTIGDITLCPSTANPELFFLVQDHISTTKTHPTSQTISKQELLAVLRQIRRRIKDQLLRSAENVHLIERKHGNRVEGIDGTKVVKHSHPEESEDEALHTKACLERLLKLPERSPFLAYPRTIQDPENTHVMLQEKLRFTTLFTLLEQSPRPPLSYTLLIIRDVIAGLEFLSKHDLRLTDIDPANIGVNLETKRGLLFDYDGLRDKDHAAAYMAKPGFHPLETIAIWNDYPGGFPLVGQETVVEEGHLVYELGQTIAACLNTYSFTEQFKPYGDLKKLSKDCVTDLAYRPSLKEVRERLERIITQERAFQTEKQNRKYHARGQQ